MFAGIYGQNIGADVSGTPASLPGWESHSLAEFAYTFSPLVEETSSDTVVIDVEGCALRFGSAYELANVITQRASKSKDAGGLGCKVNVALAANPDAAIHTAKFCRGITFTAPGEELTCLGNLPLKALQYALVDIEGERANEILETLKLWGVRTFKDFAALPVAGIAERLGQDGLKLQKLATGKTNRHLKLKQPAPVFKNSIELEYPIAQLEALSFIFARLLNQLCASLNAYALATNELCVRMNLEDQTVHERKLSLPYPLRDQKVFLKLLLLDIEMHPPHSAIIAVTIDCEPTKPRVLQTGLFIPLAPEPEKLELTLARLAKLVNPENVGSPELLDTHRPDAFRLKGFELKASKRRKGRSNQQSAISNQQSAIGNRQCLLGFRRFRPPLRALVQAEQGCPREISAWDKNKSIYGKVVYVAGPWRTSGEWWCSDTWSRDEWDVSVQPRAQPKAERERASPALQILCRLYRELSSGSWFVEGIYD